MNKGKFITFEGPEGSGKSTQILAVKSFLEKRGFEVLLTREPGGTEAGNKIRSVLLDSSSGNLEPETELFLMLAQRVEHYRKVISKAIKSGKIVLCDRYFDSSVAYQGYARGLGAETVTKIHEKFLPGFLPDCTVLLYIKPECGLERARHGGAKTLDRIESEKIDFHKRVCTGYLQMAKNEPGRFIVIEAGGSPEQISEQILKRLKQKIPEFNDE